MGNCLFGGTGEPNDVIKVVTSNGGTMEFYAPITVECITDEFPGHGIFRSHDLFWKPLPHQEVLLAGESYYLLPLNNKKTGIGGGQIAQVGHVRSNSVPSALVAPYRMSFDSHGILKRSYTEVLSRYNNGGFWKVKLVISPEQLLEILSRDDRTQELIESVRTVAKCGNGVSSVGAFSDQWSLSSSGRGNASSKKDIGLIEI
ncbi:uncharacterized protein LOC132310438 [Cornus florida]|uniref:uncharacterized protein LOC132310438 n=1 Tax=Cornus florida TaxID=4283 RepID=UPI00289B61E2|nr:uncharacterized protein LOC132310438 [Cornus florida]